MIIKYSDIKEKYIGIMNIKEYLINSKFSGALIEINGEHGNMKNILEDRIYFIIEGKGKFIIDGKENDVDKFDLVFVPKNIVYNIIGKLKYFLVCSPEFNSKNDVFM